MAHLSEFVNCRKQVACNQGLFEGKLIDFGKQTEVPVVSLANELIVLIDDVLDPLGTRKDVEYLFTLLKEGTSADRQLSCYDRIESLESVVDQLTEETMMDC